VSLISASLALSWTPAEAARSWIWALVHRVVCPFTPQLSLVLINQPQRDDGRLSWYTRCSTGQPLDLSLQRTIDWRNTNCALMLTECRLTINCTMALKKNHQLVRFSSVLRPRQHSIGYMGDGFYRSKDPTNSIKVLKERTVHRQIKHTISKHEHKTQQVP